MIEIIHLRLSLFLLLTTNKGLMTEAVEKALKKLKNLAQYKNYSEEDLIKLAEAKAEDDLKDEDDLDIENMFVDKDEKKEARMLLRKYTNTYTFESISEKNTVKQLVFLEVFNNRLQRELNFCHAQQQPSPPKTVESLHANLNQISVLKAQLGIRKDKKEGNQSDGFLALETLKKKIAKWKENNQGSRTLVCPHCGKMVLLKIRTIMWEAQKHPFFIDRFLANKHLMILLKEEKITKSDIAKVLETSTDYVDWLLDKVFPKSFRADSNEHQSAEQDSLLSPVSEGLQDSGTTES